MTKLSVKDSGTWREIKEVYVKNSGSWQQINDVYVNDSGTWRKVFQAGWIIGAGSGQSTFYTFATELIDSYDNAVLSAGPLSGNRAEGTAGTWEVILAPGYRLTGDTGDTSSYTSTYSVRYLFDVASDGSATLTAASGSQTTGGTSEMSSYSAGTTRINVTEVDITDSDEAHFPHVVEWGNSDASNRSSTFTWNPPASATSILVSGIGGGGAGGSGGPYGQSNTGSGGGGGGGGGVYVNQSATNQTFTITLGAGGLFNNFTAINDGFGPLGSNVDNQGERGTNGNNGGTTTVLVNSVSLFSATGGSGGLAGEDENEEYNDENDLTNRDTSNTGGAGGSPNGASGGKGSDRLRGRLGSVGVHGGGVATSYGFAGSNNGTTGFSGGSAGGFSVGVYTGGGGGGAGFANGGNGNGGQGFLGSGGGGGRSEGNGNSGGNGYVRVTWTS